MNVTLCRENGVYPSGGVLSAKWKVSRVSLDELQGVEISVLWHTQGKGDEDLNVHHFQRLTEAQVRRIGLADEQVVQCQLPPTPLSYHGRLISVCWCLRLRLFLSGGREIVADRAFHVVSPNFVHRQNSIRPTLAEDTSDDDESVQDGKPAEDLCKDLPANNLPANGSRANDSRASQAGTSK